jgi:CheY-like chemotaxis protein
MGDPLILLVDDNPDDIALTMRALRKSGFRSKVVVANGGVEALEYFFGEGTDAANRPRPLPQLVVLDLKMPRVDGLEVLRRLRSHERTRVLPIVILTTSNEKKDIDNCYRQGANSYIRKPVDFSKFYEVMRAIEQYWLHLNEVTPNGKNVL